MNVRPKFYAWLKSEVDYHDRLKAQVIEPDDLQQLRDLLALIEKKNPDLITFWEKRDPSVPADKPILPVPTAP